MARVVVRAGAAAAKLEEERADAARCERAMRVHAGATELVQRVAREVQEQAHAQVAGLASRCLAAVFREPYELEVRFVQRRGRTEADVLFTRDGHDVDPRTASGGGVQDVAAFALRLAALVLSRPRPRALLVLDEPFKGLNSAARPAARGLVEALSAELGVQVLLVTHSSKLACGTVVRLRGQENKEKPPTSP